MVVVTRTSEYLEHHGIQGQKWGVRNGPPYPLDYEQHNASEKSKNSKGSLDNYVNNNPKSRSAGSSNVKVKRSVKTGTVGSESSSNSSETHNKSYSDNSDKPKGLGLAIKETNESDFRRNILKNNPNAAIFDPDLVSGDSKANSDDNNSISIFFREHKKEILTGLAVAVGVTAITVGTVYVLKHRNTKVSDLQFSQILDTQGEDEFAKILKTQDPKAYEYHMKMQSIDNAAKKAKEAALHNYDLDPSNGLKELNGFSSKPQKFIAEWFSADAHRFDAITPEEFAKMNDSGLTLDKGKQMFRMSMGKHDTLRNGLEYVSITPEDRDRYKGFLPQMWKTRGFKGDQIYEAILSSNEVIKAPSKKEAISLMEKAIEKVAPGYSKDVYHSDALDHFYEYISYMTDRDASIVKAFVNELKTSGYNAVIDYNDAGRLSDLPVILLDGAKSASVNSVNSVSTKEAYDLFQNIESLSSNNSFSVSDFNSLNEAYKLAIDRYLAA